MKTGSLRHPGKGANVRGLEERTSKSHPIRADFIPREEVDAPGRLGMTFAPGMKAGTTHGGWRWKRDLRTDLRGLREEFKTDVLVSVMEEHEYRNYEVPELYERDEIERVEILRFAIRDMASPKRPSRNDTRPSSRTSSNASVTGRTRWSTAGAGLAEPERSPRPSWSPSGVTPRTRP